MFKTEHSVVHFGSNLDVLPTLEDNSVDSIVTDPPYELGFMGKKWDSSGIAYNVELWKECLRVLKPGGHLLSFGGTRTWHRIAVAIEDSGFEVRDSIAWMYGSGFPKSLDVSKAIDKGTGENKQRQLKFVNWMRSTELTAKEANKIVEKADIASHYFRLDQPAIATADLFDKLRPYLPEVPEEIERLVAERTGIEWTAYKNRKKIGEKTSGIANREEKDRHTIGASKAVQVDITESHTPEAKQWEGWGTALKPAFEPVIVARKPLIGTVAQNVLEHGTGALNIDGSRIGTTVETWPASRNYSAQEMSRPGSTQSEDAQTQSTGPAPKGRWPANVILDEYSAEILDQQTGNLKAATSRTHRADRSPFSTGVGEVITHEVYSDSGGASRFFYCPKASKTDRNERLEELEDVMASKFAQDKWTLENMQFSKLPTKNFHPTVKPTALMTYLINLVTPPNGTVLDPFTGSGSTGKAAIMAGFNFVGIELTEDYYPIIEGRLKFAETKLTESKEQEGEQLF